MFQNIRAERARLNMTITQLAAHLGVTDKTLSNWLSGKTEIPAAKLIDMAKLFSCSTDYLLGLCDDRQKGE